MPCATGFDEECINPDLEKLVCCCGGQHTNAHLEDLQNARTGPVKANEDVTDPQSTGRKRAAVLYPIEEGMACEWLALKFAGGGRFPIIGCPGGVATNRHHGPDKNTLNNSEGNVHRVCVDCHNRWHTRNDLVFTELFGTDQWAPHDGTTKATMEEILSSEVYWNTVPSQRKVEEEDGQP